MNEIIQWFMLVGLGIVLWWIWSVLNSFISYYEEEAEEIRNRVETIERQRRSQKMKWNYKPNNGWNQRELLPDGNRQIVWRDRSGEIMAGTYDPDHNIFKNTFGKTHIVSVPPSVIRWAYID